MALVRRQWFQHHCLQQPRHPKNRPFSEEQAQGLTTSPSLSFPLTPLFPFFTQQCHHSRRLVTPFGKASGESKVDCTNPNPCPPHLSPILAHLFPPKSQHNKRERAMNEEIGGICKDQGSRIINRRGLWLMLGLFFFSLVSPSFPSCPVSLLGLVVSLFDFVVHLSIFLHHRLSLLRLHSQLSLHTLSRPTFACTSILYTAVRIPSLDSSIIVFVVIVYLTLDYFWTRLFWSSGGASLEEVLNRLASRHHHFVSALRSLLSNTPYFASN